MNFNSLTFLIFLPIVVLLYWLIPQKFRWILLLAASYYFYMSWNVLLVFAIFGTTAVSYAAGLIIEKAKKVSTKKLVLTLTLVVCLGTLVYFKYFEFLLDSVVSFLNMFRLNLDSPVLDIILPVGISFYTFQTLSYVIDVYRGDFAAEKHFGYYALYVSFFPQLVAGPIERPGDLLPQLKSEHKFNWDDMKEGFLIMLCGFFRKCVVADFCGIFVNEVFGNVGKATGLSVFCAALLFLIQMYCDFAGYSEIALGCAKMMGINLTQNFDRPYTSQSFTEFFTRWHITLNRWFTYYLYIPLGGNRKGKARKVLNTVIVFALCGLWHGAGWTYLSWGLYVAFFVCLESLLKKPFGRFCEEKHVDLKNPLVVFLRRFVMMLLFVPAALMFRASNLSQFAMLFGKMFSAVGNGYFAATMQSLTIKLSDIIMIAICLACLWFFPSFKPNDKPRELLNSPSDERVFAQEFSVSIYLILATALCWLALLASQDVSAFQYFQF